MGQTYILEQPVFALTPDLKLHGSHIKILHISDDGTVTTIDGAAGMGLVVFTKK